MNDILCVHHDPENVLNKLNSYIPLKPGSASNPYKYFGTKLKQTQLHNDIWTWFISNYVQEEKRICNVYVTETLVRVIGCQRGQRIHLLPRVDTFLVLGPDQASYYQSLIGLMRWMIEIGHAEINTKVSFLLSYLVMQYRGIWK